MKPTGPTEAHRANGINYLFETMEDGWIAIWRLVNNRPVPVTQAKTKEKAIEYIVFIELAPPYLNHLIPR